MGRRGFLRVPLEVGTYGRPAVIVHIYKLIGSRNRLVVLINWAWDYFFYERAQRLILP
jgi:hypothetical protein